MKNPLLLLLLFVLSAGLCSAFGVDGARGLDGDTNRIDGNKGDVFDAKSQINYYGYGKVRYIHKHGILVGSSDATMVLLVRYPMAKSTVNKTKVVVGSKVGAWVRKHKKTIDFVTKSGKKRKIPVYIFTQHRAGDTKMGQRNQKKIF